VKHIALVLGTVVSCFAFSCGGAGPEAVDTTSTGATIERGDIAVAPGECTGVTGTWRGQVYSEPHGAFYDFTLKVTQPSPGEPELSGSILARSWEGTTEDVARPETCDGRFHWTVVEDGAGSVGEDGSIRFEGVNWQVGEHLCGEPVATYSPDKFDAVASKDETTGETTLSGIVTDGAAWSQAGLHVELTRASCP
jgi:hypothetical protein